MQQLPEGQQMFQTKLVRKQTEQQLQQVQNRIKFIQRQEMSYQRDRKLKLQQAAVVNDIRQQNEKQKQDINQRLQCQNDWDIKRIKVQEQQQSFRRKRTQILITRQQQKMYDVMCAKRETQERIMKLEQMKKLQKSANQKKKQFVLERIAKKQQDARDQYLDVMQAHQDQIEKNLKQMELLKQQEQKLQLRVKSQVQRDHQSSFEF